MKIRSLFLGMTLLITTACQPIQAMPAASSESTAGEVDLPIVQPVLETDYLLDVDVDTLPTGERPGDADDPAIWVHPTDPAQSLVIAALKEGGLDVYNLNGETLLTIAPEGVRYNNVDLLYGFPLLGDYNDPSSEGKVDLAIATDRYKDTLAIFVIDRTTLQLQEVSDPANALIFTPAGEASNQETTAYGLATYAAPDGNFYAFVSRRETGDLAQLRLFDNTYGNVRYEVVRTLTLPIPEGGELADAQIEGMVVDQMLGTLYIGQENVGVWKVDAAADSNGDAQLLHAVRPAGEYLEADVEGLAIYYGPGEEGYLLVSSQGDNTFAIFKRSGNNEYLGSFGVGSNGEIDSAEESDGAHIVNVSLGERFPNGLLVVHDGLNDPEFLVEDDGEMENASTNFKFVAWEAVANAFEPPLLIDTLK